MQSITRGESSRGKLSRGKLFRGELFRINCPTQGQFTPCYYLKIYSKRQSITRGESSRGKLSRVNCPRVNNCPGVNCPDTLLIRALPFILFFMGDSKIIDFVAVARSLVKDATYE